jgi:hypothetical protein
MQAATGRFEMRLEPSELDRIDEWRGRQSDVPSRSEAVRRLLSAALSPRVETTQMRTGERLTVWLLCDLLEGLEIEGEINPKFVKEAIVGGHFWALEKEYSGLLGAQNVDRDVVKEVINFLDMWHFIEDSTAKFTKKERQAIAKDSGWLHPEFQFMGFDHQSEEIEHLSVARFMVEKLGWFSFVKGRDLDAHFPTLDDHRRMYSVFEPIRPKLVGRLLNSEELTSVLTARR